MGSLLKYVLVGIAMVLCSTVPSRADTINLTFEGLKNLEPIQNFYNGGTGGGGSGPGPAYGISFGPDALALVADFAGGSGNENNHPSGVTCAFFLSGLGDVMNVAAGFGGGFSFFYSATYSPGNVQVYDGLDGTGNLLANISLPTTPDDPRFPENFDTWAPAGVSFDGIAKSVVFSGTANQIVFDNITLGSNIPVAGVPEPASFVLAGLGGLGCFIGYALRRHRKAIAA
jgi:hypothetical protein